MINTDKYPLLSQIDSPADLRRLDVERLPDLCAEIRQFLIAGLSVNPGHFASSMGAVEITVALHYVFDTPDDRLVWDVGHQAYAHKLLTGRRDAFTNNRKMGGLSGFPNPSESPYDAFTAGHASNSISAALGMSVASRLTDGDKARHTVAIIGDASISGGLAFEGINNAANTPNNLMIILNDNDMSIDKNVGSLHSYLTRINTSKSYNNLRYKMYRFFRRIHLIGDNGKGFVLRFNNAMKSVIGGTQNIFEGLNVRYFGPFDGHDVRKLVKVFNETKDLEGPKILHLRTVKGKGYAPAEADPANWHAPGKFNPETGERQTGSSSTPKYQDVFGQALTALAGQNPRLVAITAAMPTGTSISVMQEAFPSRVFDVGISEGHAVTFAGGLAKEGLLPAVGIYSSFLQRAYDNIIHDVAIQHLPVVFAIDRAGLVGEDGVTHHGVFDMAYLSVIPGMTVAAPSDAITLRNLLYTATLRADGPYAIRYPRGSADRDASDIPFAEMPVGKGRKLTDGTDAVILSLGPIKDEVTKAIAILAEKGISVAHYDMLFLKPIDTEILSEVAAMNVPVVTVEDGCVTGGLSSTVAAWMKQNNVNVPLHTIGIPDSFIHQGTIAQLRKICGMDAASIAATLIK